MNFIKWLQGRLVEHGHDIWVDGVVGPQTRGALRAFQSANGLKQSGVADTATVSALRGEPGNAKNTVTTASVPEETMPPWMAEMYRRMGLHETRNNKSLSEWLRFGKYLGNPAKLPWCGDAMETCIVKTLDEPVPNNPFWAQAWKDFGRDADVPTVGAIGVIRWSPSAGHVGIIADSTASRIKMLGGNQSNEINLTWFPRSKFIAFRWPNTFPIKLYPPLTGASGSGGRAGTR